MLQIIVLVEPQWNVLLFNNDTQLFPATAPGAREPPGETGWGGVNCPISMLDALGTENGTTVRPIEIDRLVHEMWEHLNNQRQCNGGVSNGQWVVVHHVD